ncbi:hypothetical protein PVAG01_09711 [Phlyctema vagabunda]|uniref:Uncharacterized protein n=1 Tax=Phlyctema vagabunda TaxID=108571 RepID=A0ABR4P879_9HELO
MTMSIQDYAGSVFLSFLGVVALISCVAVTIISRRLWKTRGFYTRDFRRLSAEAQKLSLTTMIIRRDVDTSRKLGKVNMELLNAADDLDTSIRIALCSWQDIMDPNCELDIEAGKGSRKDKHMRKAHARYVIELMRRKSMEGLEKRRELSYPLEKLHASIKDRSPSQSRQAIDSITDIVHKRNISSEKSEMNLKLWPAHIGSIPSITIAVPSKASLGPVDTK